MFDTTLSGKAGSITLRYSDSDRAYEAILTGGEKILRLQDTDLSVLFKQVREHASDKLVLLSFRKLTINMIHGLRELQSQRKAFVVFAKPEFAKIKSKLQSERGAKGFGRKGSKKIVKGATASKSAKKGK